MSHSRSRPVNISVISANYNGAEHLKSCISSVVVQADVNVEHIIIDGGSTDESLNILEQSTELLSYWRSEPDNGIADAMNKGISKATGEWLLFLHSDDQLLDKDSLSKAMAILATTSALIVGLPVLYGSFNNRKILSPRGANAWLLLKTGFLHQGTFIHQSVFNKIGLYDSSYRIAMDYEFFLRAWKKHIPAIHYSKPIVSWMRDTGVSSQLDWTTLSKRFNEEKQIQIKHSNYAIQRFCYRVYWLFYLTYRKLLSLLGRIIR